MCILVPKSIRIKITSRGGNKYTERIIHHMESITEITLSKRQTH